MQSRLFEKKANSSSISSFDQIYNIAKESKLDKKNASRKLNQILKNAALDQINCDDLTPAGKLAMEGDNEAAEFLLNSKANVEYIAGGAALGGHREYAEYLRLNHELPAGGFIASCAGRGGHREYCEYLYLNGTVFEHPEVNIAEGAALGGHLRLAEDYIRINDTLSINLNAESAARGGYREYAENLRLRHGADVNWIAHGAAIGGHYDYAEELRLNHNANVSLIVGGAVQGGHIEYAEYLYKNFCADIKIFARRIIIHNYIPNKTGTLRVLAENDQLRIAVDNELKNTYEPSPELIQLVNKARIIASFKPKYNFEQCLALGHRETLVWYLQCASLVKGRKIPLNLFILIGGYLTTMNNPESKDFYVKFRFDMFQKFLVKDVNNYCASKRWFYLFGGDKKAKTFSLDCANAKNYDELKPMLEKGINEDGQDDKLELQRNPLRDMVARHYKRFNSI